MKGKFFPISFWFNAIAGAYWKHLPSFIGFIIAFFIFIQSGKSRYNAPCYITEKSCLWINSQNVLSQSCTWQSSPFDECKCSRSSTCATSLMHVKNSTHYFCLLHLLSSTLEWKNWKTKTSILIVDHFFKPFVNRLFAWMLYFHEWLEKKEENSKFGVNTIIILPYSKCSHVSRLEPQLRHIQNIAKHLRWSVLRKWLPTKSC